MSKEETPRKKGRPAGRPAGSNSTVIEDKVLLPYKIYVDANCYNVVDANSPNDIEKGYGYFTSLGNALKKVAKMQITNNEKYSLEGFIKAFDDRLKEFDSKFIN